MKPQFQLSESHKAVCAPLSSSVREFLLDLYELSEQTPFHTNYLTAADLTHLLNVSPAALNRGLAQLKKLKLIEHHPYQGFRLTATGRQTALPWIRKYRIAEAFLHRVVEFEWHEVQDEAKRLIGGMNEAVTQRMFEMAGSPLTCPHGEPIPATNGIMPKFDDQPLCHAGLKIPLVITRVLAREPERLKYISALRLLPGTMLQVTHVAPFIGPLQIKLTDEYRIIGHNLAEIIYVRNDD